MHLLHSKECRRALLFTDIIKSNHLFLLTNDTDDATIQPLMMLTLSGTLNVVSDGTGYHLVHMQPLAHCCSLSAAFHGSFLALKRVVSKKKKLRIKSFLHLLSVISPRVRQSLTSTHLFTHVTVASGRRQ